MDQSLSQCRIFYEVAEAGNISRVVKELYISQPTISKSISKLEDSLDTALFSRSSRGVQLTRGGQILSSHTSAAFDALSQGKQKLRCIKNFHVGRINIGVSNTSCQSIMISYLEDYVEKYPHVEITIESQSSTHTLAVLSRERIDISLMAESRYQKSLVFLPVMEIEDIFVAAPSHLGNLRLRGGERADMFQDGNIMLLDHNNVTHHYTDDYMNIDHIETNSLLRVATVDLLIESVRIDLGAAYVIGKFVEEGLETGRLVQLQPDTLINGRTIGFAYHPNRSSRALGAFIDLIRHAIV